MNAPRLPLLVVALGGNAISPPRGDLSIATERAVLAHSVTELAAVAQQGRRLLIVHGNGPQVGRLLTMPGMGAPETLDVHVAQTQGELGYLMAEALDRALPAARTAALVTRVLVDADDPAFVHPTKPVGAVLPRRPVGVPAVRLASGGWRRVVASPRPTAVIELPAIQTLLPTHHVIAGGGGGVALAVDAPARCARPAVVDKDWVAALLAIALDAEGLVFVTDVAHAFDRFGHVSQAPIERMTAAAAGERLEAGAFAPGSMGPKVESAVQFVQACGRPAVIATIGQVDAALRGLTGTTIEP